MLRDFVCDLCCAISASRCQWRRKTVLLCEQISKRCKRFVERLFINPIYYPPSPTRLQVYSTDVRDVHRCHRWTKHNYCIELCTLYSVYVPFSTKRLDPWDTEVLKFLLSHLTSLSKLCFVNIDLVYGVDMLKYIFSLCTLNQGAFQMQLITGLNVRCQKYHLGLTWVWSRSQVWRA